MRLRDSAALLRHAIPYAGRYLWANRRGCPETPMALSFLVTARCPLECRHCFYHRAPRDGAGELSVDEYRALSAGLGPIGLGLFCGGEPFVRDDLAEIVGTFRENNGLLVTLLSTNGQLTSAIVAQTEAMLRRRPASRLLLLFSIDGFREEHERNRGAGTFEQALCSWRECQRLACHHPHLELGIATVLSSLNEARARDFVRWAWHALRPESFRVLLVRQQPRDGDHLKRVAPEAYRATQMEALAPLVRRRGWPLRHPEAIYLEAMARRIHRTMIDDQRSFRCQAGRHGALIDPFGRLHACEVLAEHPDVEGFGDLRAVGLRFSALWNGSAAERLRGFIGRHPACVGCTHETMGYLPSLPFERGILRAALRRPGRLGRGAPWI